MSKFNIKEIKEAYPNFWKKKGYDFNYYKYRKGSLNLYYCAEKVDNRKIWICKTDPESCFFDENLKSCKDAFNILEKKNKINGFSVVFGGGQFQINHFFRDKKMMNEIKKKYDYDTSIKRDIEKIKEGFSVSSELLIIFAILHVYSLIKK